MKNNRLRLKKFSKLKDIFENSQKGISLYLALIILSLNLSIVLGVTIILIDEIEMTKDLGYSVIAFYAADTGIELVMNYRNSPATTSDPVNVPAYEFYFDLNNNGTEDYKDASYDVYVIPSGVGGCTADNFCVKSVGRYQEIRRALKATY